jgi:hypothetical protein
VECEMPAPTPERGGRNTGAIIAGAMDSEGVEPPGAATERVVGHTGVSAAQLASVLSRTADTLERARAPLRGRRTHSCSSPTS